MTGAAVAQALLPALDTSTSFEKSDADFVGARAVAFTSAPDGSGLMPVRVQVPLASTVAVVLRAVPSTYTVITVPAASVEVPVTVVAPFCKGEFTTGGAVRAGMLLPGGSEPPVVAVEPPMRSIKALSILGAAASFMPLISEIFW